MKETLTATLTERYIYDVTASLPPAQQQDVRTELAASIADQIEARIEQGEDAADAERAVLTDLGDPLALAASYADRPLHLLGPRFYLTWRRIALPLTALLAGLVALGVTIGNIVDEVPWHEIVIDGVATTVTVAVQVLFWLTLAFVIMDRTGATNTEAWSVKSLKPISVQPQLRGSAWGEIVVAAIALGALAWDAFIGLAWVDGERIQVLHPDFWPVWGGIAVASLVIPVLISVHATRVGRRTVASSVVSTVVSLVGLAAMIWLLATNTLFSAEFTALIDGALSEALGGFTASPVTNALIALLVIVTIIDLADTWWHTIKSERLYRASLSAA